MYIGMVGNRLSFLCASEMACLHVSSCSKIDKSLLEKAVTVPVEWMIVCLLQKLMPRCHVLSTETVS